MALDNTRDDFDIETLAAKAVDTLAVSARQVIAIWASTHSLDLIEALAFRIRQRGAFWTLRLTTESLLRRIGQDVPETYLDLIPEHELRWLADVQAIISVRDHGGHMSGVSLLRRRKVGAEWIALIDEATRRGIRQLVVVNPTRALASAYGVPLLNLRRSYWQAINVGEQAISKNQQKAKARLAEARQVHITSELGTDLHLRIDRRRVYLDEDTIPRGEVYMAPHEDSAEGIAVIDRMLLKGKPVERLRLTFAHGRLVRIEGPGSSADSFGELLAASNGDKDVIAEFAVGLNPGIAEPTGDLLLDEKMYGSVHIAIGMNDRFGGRNRSNLHLDLVMLRPVVRLDGTPFIDHGVLSF